MASKPPPPNKRPKPSPGEAIARARAAAAPKLEAAAAAAAPKVEKAAQAAGGFLSILRDRAKETAKGFSEGYGAPDDEPQQAEPAAQSDEPPGAAPRPRPGPRSD